VDEFGKWMGTPADKNKPATLPGITGPASEGGQKKGTTPKFTDSETSAKTPDGSTNTETKQPKFGSDKSVKTPKAGTDTETKQPKFGSETSAKIPKSTTKSDKDSRGSVATKKHALTENTFINQETANSLGVGYRDGKLVDKFGNEYTDLGGGVYRVDKAGDQYAPIPTLATGSQVDDTNFMNNFGGYGSKQLSPNTYEDAAGNIWQHDTTNGIWEVIKEGSGMTPPAGTGVGPGGDNVLPFGDDVYHPPPGHPFPPPPGGVNVNVFPLGGAEASYQ
jgi:hypothetical protein